ncbi:MAG: alanine racemase [Alphaproteobacteria bacterium]|nr:alanine racemase [Alphaproteobacteria bacterium]
MTADDFPPDCRATLTINLGAVITNYKHCGKLASTAECAAVVKANAYGMGSEQVARTLFNQAGCRSFFVANLTEAITLRRVVPTAVIYVLNGIFPAHTDYFIHHNIRPVLNDPGQIKLWSELDQTGTRPCAVHFDTGINRLGLSSEETRSFVTDTALRKKLNIALIMSHLACADDAANPMNSQQLNKFTAIRQHFPDVAASLANSGGILLGPDYHFDLVRPGLMIFGGNPHRGKEAENIDPVCRISGRILQLRQLESGQTVGYGVSWTADRPCHIAIINIGYADGYPQLFNNCGRVYINGRMLPVIGRVSMDMIAVDVSELNPDEINVRTGVELLGEHITLEMASEVSTLSQYEILTGVRERYQRIYQ